MKRLLKPFKKVDANSSQIIHSRPTEAGGYITYRQLHTLRPLCHQQCQWRCGNGLMTLEASQSSLQTQHSRLGKPLPPSVAKTSLSQQKVVAERTGRILEAPSTAVGTCGFFGGAGAPVDATPPLKCQHY